MQRVDAAELLWLTASVTAAALLLAEALRAAELLALPGCQRAASPPCHLRRRRRAAATALCSSTAAAASTVALALATNAVTAYMRSQPPQLPQQAIIL